jgi:hypothetical protein
MFPLCKWNKLGWSPDRILGVSVGLFLA